LGRFEVGLLGEFGLGLSVRCEQHQRTRDKHAFSRSQRLPREGSGVG